MSPKIKLKNRPVGNRYFSMRIDQRIQSVFPSTRVTVKKRAMTDVELMGFDKDSDREALDSILQEVWEDESWR